MSSMQQSSDNFVTAPLISSYQSATPKASGNGNQWVEKTKFDISFSSAVVVVLHKDVVTLSTPFGLEPETVQAMRELYGLFFKELGLFSVVGKRDVDRIRQSLNKACNKSCHRLVNSAQSLHHKEWHIFTGY